MVCRYMRSHAERGNERRMILNSLEQPLKKIEPLV
jgi:hypothetical protein